MRPPSVLASLNGSLHQLMREDERVVVLGEDLLDPYGGAFKVTAGLSSEFPARVFTCPISELGFTGIAVGMALRGMRPIVEIMFGDFLMLAADQLLNHATKYAWMYNGKVNVPLVVRAPMGGRRGYGPTHSQTLEKHFVGMAGLTVIAPSPFHDPGTLLGESVALDSPVLFVENKLMYARLLHKAGSADYAVRATGGPFPTVSLSFDEFTEADVTIVAYGGMAEIAVRAAEHLLMEHELLADIVIPSSLAPIDLQPVADSLARSGRLLVCEESTPFASWGSELITQVASAHWGLLAAAPARVSAHDVPIANTRTLEDAILPQEADIVTAARSITASAAMRLVQG